MAGALVNIDLFGDQTLAAYFFYCIAATGVAMIFAFRLLFVPPLYRSAILVLPAPQLLFIVLALFVFAHGLITHTPWPDTLLLACRRRLVLGRRTPGTPCRSRHDHQYI